ncbi:lysophospholipid acyltransferase family protein [Gordonia sp. (in: high G+C Gram-positive bacteria)]|uniref:lysophospholipid acyltransferase family protein n=1 Tax=Gordonia sp. (in: high G+C Gram-positive bacteria) TaxID=84139 RepID=UPI0039E417B9
MTHHAWYPVAECNGDCLRPPRTAAGRLRTVMRVVRLLAVALMLAALAPVAWRVAPQRRHRLAAWSSRLILSALGVTVVVDDRRFGDRPEQVDPRLPVGGLIVANHVSFLDILAIATVAPARFVAKSEVLQMPGFGALARRVGVIGIRRASLRELPATVDRVADALRAGGAVAVFPEGTTWCGADRGRFRPAFFSAAHAAGSPIMPITLTFAEDDGHHCPAAAFIGDDSPVDTLRRIIAVRAMTITVTAHPVHLPTPDRRADARAAEAVVLGRDHRSDSIGAQRDCPSTAVPVPDRFTRIRTPATASPASPWP